MEARPKIKLVLTTADKIVEIIGWLTLVILWNVTLWSYSNLPDTIPIHYNIAGQVDNYGSKVTIFILPIMGTILFIGMTILNMYPHIFNYPTKITIDNAARQYSNATRMFRYLKFTILLIFSFIVFKTLQITKGESQGLEVWFLPITLGLIFIPITIFLIKSFREKN